MVANCVWKFIQACLFLLDWIYNSLCRKELVKKDTIERRDCVGENLTYTNKVGHWNCQPVKLVRWPTYTCETQTQSVGPEKEKKGTGVPQ